MNVFVANAVFGLVLCMVLVLTFVARGMLLRRAVLQVLAMLRARHSRCSEYPKSLDELGLRPRDFIARLTRTRDYKPDALRALVKIGAVRITQDERVCLIEENLAKTLRPEKTL